jgi:hypothetical protein
MEFSLSLVCVFMLYALATRTMGRTADPVVDGVMLVIGISGILSMLVILFNIIP